MSNTTPVQGHYDTSSVFVAVIGRPNVGKSSLTNLLVGEKVAIVTSKPQTTRTRITGVITRGPLQYVLLDTPGVHKARNKLGKRMDKTASDSIADVDVSMMLFEPYGALNESEMVLVDMLRSSGGPAIAVINKTDLVKDAADLEARKEELKALGVFDDIYTVSVRNEDGCETLFDALSRYAVEGPHYFDDDAYTDMPEKELVAEVADAIWDYAELSMQEVKSAALFVKVLKAEGFQVEEGICGIPTAFSASFGSGGPVIGLLAEYDALSGLSQAAGSTAYHELVKGGSGHGCGHNLLGAGAMAAAIGLKHYLTQTGKSGTVILYGCPGEEGVASKAYMAREGLWYGLDAALTWHPGDSSEVTTGSTNSCIQMIYTFHGLASQASTAPERGRSALDAVELMNVGVQFLREHMPRDARVHYSILDAGGVSPNVVQHQASVLYMIRSNFVKDCMALHQRVDKIAQGAALMTDTTIERRFVDGLSDTVCNHALEKVLYDNFSQLGVPPCTAEEHAFMEALSATYEGRDVPGGVGAENDPAFAEKVKAMQTGHFNDFLMPLYQGPAFNAGSTDVGDVSYQCPTAQIHVAVWPNHVPCHSWQVVSCNKTPMAHKATVHAGKVLCAAAIDLLEQPALLEAAKAEFRQRTAGGYTCPIPPDAVPAPLEL